MAVEAKRHRFTVAEYEEMGRAGILGEGDRVELVEGEIAEMRPIGPRHASSIIRLTQLFSRFFGGQALVSPQNPAVLNDYSEPQPDLQLLRLRDDFYATAHPRPEDVLLLVEVSDTTVAYDRGTKVPLYARGGIPELWLVDLERESLTVYREPAEGAYQTARVLRRGDSIAPAAFPDASIAVADVLG